MKTIIQMHISLQDSNPEIWRRVLVSGDTSFFELHNIIQIVMGWQNSHLFEFNLDGYRIGEIFTDFRMEGTGPDEIVDSRTTTLKDLVTRLNYEFINLYDFGDYWLHQIKVENFLEKQAHIKYPVCLDGQINCPPDDSGGISNFYESMGILKDKKYPEYKENAIWFGKSYVPAKFDKEKANRKLKKLKKYIKDWDS